MNIVMYGALRSAYCGITQRLTTSRHVTPSSSCPTLRCTATACTIKDAHRVAGSQAGEELSASLLSVLHVLAVTQHADPAVYARLLQCSRAARDWVLTTAPHATLNLRPPKVGLPLGLWRAQLAAAQRALATRGTLPTSPVLLLCQDSQPDALNMLPDALRGAQGVTQFRIVPDPQRTEPYQATVAKAISYVAAAAPNLRSLDIQCPCPLPDPSLLPHVTSLAIRTNAVFQGLWGADDWGADRLQLVELASAARYISQLASIEISVREDRMRALRPITWPRLFADTTHTLTKLTTNTQLNDDLVAAVLKHAPNLAELSVGHCGMTPAHASKEWAVSKVTLQSASLLGLHNLPQYKGGSVQLCFPGGKVNMIVEKGLDPDTVSRLDQWTVHTEAIDLVYLRSGQDQPDALRTVLAQLKGLQAPRATLRFCSWDWTTLAGEVFTTALPTLSHLHFAPLPVPHE